MKKLSFITGMLICVLLLLAALGAICGTVDQMARDERFYGDMSRAAVAKYLGTQDAAQVTAYIGMDAAQQGEFAAQMAAFMAGETDAQPQVLSDKEQQHMLDVRSITKRAADMSKTCMSLAVALAVVAAWTGSRLKKRAKPCLIGGLAAATIVAALAYGIISRLAGGGFEELFIKMHELLFTNDLWLMNPDTDIIIRMMPQTLFEQALTDGAGQTLRMLMIVVVMLAAVHEIVLGMIRRQLAKGEKV